jgi:8-oxo-dGTP pyrophosphatase MutT (NUDIX family)
MFRVGGTFAHPRRQGVGLNFDLPRDVIMPVGSVDVRLDPASHPFELANADAIQANWLKEIGANPALFDGRVVLLSHLTYADEALAGRCHEVRYATLLYWLRKRPAGGAGHAFAHAMLVSRDNALIAVEMGSHTVNAGRVYFAAGSFEPSDFPGGQVDLHLNMMREVLEETGLDIDTVRRDGGYIALSTDRGTVIARRYHLDADANEIAERIRAFVAAEPEPEIVGPVVIGSPRDLPQSAMGHMPRLVAWHFS